MGAALSKGYLGWLAIKKTAGQTGSGPAIGTQFSMPVARVAPRNPANLAYPLTLNAIGAPSLIVQAKKTPSVTITDIPLKASFFSAQLVNSLAGGAPGFLDSSYNSDEYAIGVHNGNSLRVYDGAKFTHVVLQQAAPDGQVKMDLTALCVYGDNEKGTPTSFTTPTTDAGNLYDVTKVSFGAGADSVQSWRLALMRPQGYNPYCDGTVYSDVLQSGVIGGTLRLRQSALAATVPTTSLTISIGSTGSGVAIALNLQLDERSEDVTPAMGTVTRDYTLINTGAAFPVAISAF